MQYILNYIVYLIHRIAHNIAVAPDVNAWAIQYVMFLCKGGSNTYFKCVFLTLHCFPSNNTFWSRLFLTMYFTLINVFMWHKWSQDKCIKHKILKAVTYEATKWLIKPYVNFEINTKYKRFIGKKLNTRICKFRNVALLLLYIYICVCVCVRERYRQKWHYFALKYNTQITLRCYYRCIKPLLSAVVILILVIIFVRIVISH